jgi:hypothetical protein
MERFVFPGLESHNAALKKLSFNCLALCSLNDRLFGAENILLFVNIYKNEIDRHLAIQVYYIYF